MKVQKKEKTLARALLLFSAFLIAGTSEVQVAAGNDAPVLGGTLGTSEPAGAPSTYRLIGTVGGRVLVGAVLDDAAGAQTFYRLRDTLPDGSQIVKVQSDSISVKRSDGMVYELYIIHDMKTAAPSARSPVSASPAAPRSTDNQRMTDRPTRAERPRRMDMAPGQAPGAAPDAGVRGGKRDRRNNPRNPKADNQGTGANQGTYGPGSNNAAPGEGPVRRVPRQRGSAPQSPD